MIKEISRFIENKPSATEEKIDRVEFTTNSVKLPFCCTIVGVLQKYENYNLLDPGTPLKKAFSYLKMFKSLLF